MRGAHFSSSPRGEEPSSRSDNADGIEDPGRGHCLFFVVVTILKMGSALWFDISRRPRPEIDDNNLFMHRPFVFFACGPEPVKQH